MSAVFIVIGIFTVAFIFLMGLAIFCINHDYDTMTEEQFGQEPGKEPVESDKIHWGDVRP